MSRACSRLASFLVQAERQLNKGWAGTQTLPTPQSWKNRQQTLFLCSDLMVKVLLKFGVNHGGKAGPVG